METNLSNLNLLSEEVAHNINSESLKAQRMQQVEQTANRPTEEKDNVINMPNLNPNQNQNPNQTMNQNQPMNPNMNPNFQRPQPQYQPQPQNQPLGDDDYDDEDEEYSAPQQNAPAKEETKKSNVDGVAKEKTILGMKPILFYGLTAIVLGTAAYFTYRHFKGKGAKTLKAPMSSGGDVAKTVADSATETAKVASNVAGAVKV